MKKICLALAVMISFTVSAQTKLSLQDLSDFKPQAGNWSVVEDVTISRSIDIHAPPPVVEKKKKKKKVTSPIPQAVTFNEGSGILLNMNDESIKDNLITDWEHGDIELELEVMLPKGSNSGIYLQGRYEIQLIDSWGVKKPKFTDIGGIYRNWETTPGKILKGIPPRTNASKAPGLWQSIKLLFQAPKFNKQGEKISNARFVYVDLNGIRIHSNVEVELPTGGPIENNEVAKGPLMLQGDHGPVALRNISYRLLEESAVELKNLSYQVFKGDFNRTADLTGSKAISEGNAKSIDISTIGLENGYGVVYKGELVIPKVENYNIKVGFSGGFQFTIDGKVIMEQQSSGSQARPTKTMELTAGTHSFTLINIKTAGWQAPRLGLYFGSESTYSKPLHAYASYPESADMPISIFVDAQSTKLHRAFTYYKNGSTKLSHTIAVGSPAGVHYVYDLETANLIAGWRGDFVDATPMWHSRGDGSFRPRGMTQWKFLGQPLAYLSDRNIAFPVDPKDNEFASKGYEISESDGHPIFSHLYQKNVIKDEIKVNALGTHLIHTVSIPDGMDKTDLYYKVAEGAKIQQLDDGSFSIGEKEYYVEAMQGGIPFIRTVDGQQELVVPVSENQIVYALIW